MRRAGAWVCVVAATAAAAICGFAPWPLSPARVGDSLNAAFGASSRLRWRAPDAVAFAALPWPRLNVVDARLDDAFGVNLLSAPRARLDLSVGALLRGRLAPVRVALANPIVSLDLDRPPFAGLAEGSAGATPVTSALAPLASLSLSNGVMRLVSKTRGLDTVINNLQGRIDGLTIDGALRFDASAVWRDTPLAIAGELTAPEAAAGGSPSPLRLSLASPVADLAFNGTLVGGGAPSAEGDVTASVASLAALLRLFSAAPPSFLSADDVAIAGKVTATPNDLMFDEATVTSAHQTLEGALEVAEAGGRPVISGTLAADRLALAPIFDPPAPWFDPVGGWSAKPFAPAPLRTFELDLRLSAGQLDLYGPLLANAAASVILKDGVLTASLIEAAAYQGRLHGEARVASVSEDLVMRAGAELTDADLGAAFADFGWPVASGRGTARFAIETSGQSPEAAVAGLSGSASSELSDGAIAGVNLEEALRRSQRRPFDVSRDLRLGETAFDRLAVEFALIKGVAHVVSGEMTSHGLAAGLGGAIDLAGRSWNLRVTAKQTDASGEESLNAAHLTLDVDGPWSSPAIRVIGENEGLQRETDPPSPAP